MKRVRELLKPSDLLLKLIMLKKLLKKLLEKNNNLLTFRYGTFSHCLVHIVQNFYQYYQYFDQTIGFNEIIHVLNSFFRQLTQDFRIRSYLFSLKIISVSTQQQYVFFSAFSSSNFIIQTTREQKFFWNIHHETFRQDRIECEPDI